MHRFTARFFVTTMPAAPESLPLTSLLSAFWSSFPFHPLFYSYISSRPDWPTFYYQHRRPNSLAKILPTSSTSVMSSPFGSQNTSRNVSPSRQVYQPSLSMTALATYVEDPRERLTDDAPSGSGSVGWGIGSDDGTTRAALGPRPAQTAEAAAAAADKAIAIAAAWTGTVTGEVKKEESSVVEGAEIPSASAGPPSPISCHAPPVRTAYAVPSVSGGSPVLAAVKPHQVEAPSGETSLMATISPAAGGFNLDDDPASAPTEENRKGSVKDQKEKLDQGQESRDTPNRRPPLGTGVRTDPASHQHKRPVRLVRLLERQTRASGALPLNPRRYCRYFVVTAPPDNIRCTCTVYVDGA